MIAWTAKSGPVWFKSADRLYTVSECYREGRVMYRATFSGCLSCTPLGEVRETPELAKFDAEQHYKAMTA